MKPSGLFRVREGGRAGWIGLATLAAAALGGCLAPQAALPAARFAATACLQPALGCLIFALIHRITGGQWGESLRRPWAAGIRLVPWLWPILALIALAQAARPDLPLPTGSAPMPGAAMLGARAVVYELILIVLCGAALRPRWKPQAGPALIVLLFTGHFLAADAFFVLEPGWYSTGFPLVWLAICAASGLAIAVMAAAASGVRPAEAGAAGRPLGLDWGNLLLTAVVFATYLVIMEFLIIWSANLPAEISWFLRRKQGGWPYLALALVAVHLAFPFLLLLSRRWKESPRGVPFTARIVAGAGVLWALWLVIPPFADRGWGMAPFALVFLVAGAAVCWSRYQIYFDREIILSKTPHDR